MLVFACLEWGDQNCVWITMLGYHEVLVKTSCLDWESACIISVEFNYVHCVNVEFSWACSGKVCFFWGCFRDISLWYFRFCVTDALSWLDYMSFYGFIRLWAVFYGVGQGESGPSAVITHLDGLEPRGTDWKSRCSVEVPDGGLYTWQIISVVSF